MNNTKPIIINSITKAFGYVNEFEIGTYSRVFTDLLEKYRKQSPKNVFMWLLMLRYLSHELRRKVVLKLIANAKITHDGCVISDSKYSVNIKDRCSVNANERAHFQEGGLKRAISEPFLIYCKPEDDRFTPESYFQELGKPHIPFWCRKEYWSKNDGDVHGGDLIGFVMEFRGCDVISAIEFILSTIGVDLSAPQVSQPQILDGWKFIEFAGNYEKKHDELEYEAKIFQDGKKTSHYTSTGIRSFWLIELKFVNEVFHVFRTLQSNNVTGVCSWMFLAPEDKYLNEHLYELLHGKKRNGIIESVAPTHSKRVGDSSVENKSKYILWPLFEKGEIGLIVSLTGVGKTQVSLEIAIAMSCGGNIGQRLVATKSRKVLYVIAEMSELEFVGRCDLNFGYHTNSAQGRDNFSYVHLPSIGKVLDLTKESDQLWLLNEIQDAEFVVLDHLRLLISNSALKSEVEWKKFITFCRELTSKGITLLIPHQETKQGLALGLGSVTQDVDVVVSLEKPKNCPDDRTLIEFNIDKFRHARGKEHSQFVISYTKENEQIKRTVYASNQDDNSILLPLVAREEMEKHSLTNLEVEILSKAKIGSVKAGDFISKATYGRSASTVTNALAHLYKLELLERNGVGSGTYYTAVENVQEDL